MYTPYSHQIEKAVEGYQILKKNALVYLAMEERTGKSLTALLIAEMCKNVKSVHIITTKKAKGDASEGWIELINNYSHNLDIAVSTFGTAHKVTRDFDLYIVDEAHKYISGYPKPSATQAKIKKLTVEKPIIYLSATPNAQGYQQLYHQFDLSSWSPWRKHKHFYSWFQLYGREHLEWINGRMVEQYDTTDEQLCRETTNHLFVRATRKELGFEHEPKDKLHYVQLSDETKKLYNQLLKDKCLFFDDCEFLADTAPKLRFALHMLEGGGLKIDNQYKVLKNREKIDYILQNWGDTEDVAIFYQYKVEKLKLEKIFQHAAILQSTSYAEGVDLSGYKHLIIYSQDFSTARHTQRRARQANKKRDEEIIVHFLLVEDGISEQVYETVSINKENFVDTVFERKELW